MVSDVGASPSVFSWPGEEEESNPDQVSDFLLLVRVALVDGV